MYSENKDDSEFISEALAKKIFFVALTIGVTGIILTTIIYFIQGHISFNDIDSEKIGAFGGFIGGVFGTTFTIAATILIWLTYTSQKRELEKTSELAKKQFQNVEIQRFENTFFNMINTFLKIPSSIQGELPLIEEDFYGDLIFAKTVDGDLIMEELKGKIFFKKAISSFILFFSKHIHVEENEVQEVHVKSLYSNFYLKYLTELDHYFRFFYNTLKFIDKSNLKNKASYGDMLQAILSKEELSLIYFNGIGKTGKVKLFPLLEKYNFLENVNPALIVKLGDLHKRLYPTTTFRFLDEEEKAKRIAIVIEQYVTSNELGLDEAKNICFEIYNCDSARKEEVNRLLETKLTTNN